MACAARSVCVSTAVRAAGSSVTPSSAVLPSISAASFSSSSISAADQATPSDGAAAQPYFIEQVPIEETGAPKTKWGHATIKGVRGHTKKLNPIARQLKGLAVNEAMVLMAFSGKKRSDAAKAALDRAARNAGACVPN
jgi:Ribosomal protein L22p/L17e